MAANEQQLNPDGETSAAGGAAEQPQTEPVPADLGDIATLKSALDEAKSKSQEHYDRWIRSQAEMENLRKRSARELEAAHKFAIERFASAVLTVKDSLEMGLDASRSTNDVSKLREGMELTLKQLRQILDKFNIREVNPQGQAFNPEQHQAMMTQESVEHPPNTVLSVLSKGYVLNERLLRPATVTVSKAPQS